MPQWRAVIQQRTTPDATGSITTRFDVQRRPTPMEEWEDIFQNIYIQCSPSTEGERVIYEAERLRAEWLRIEDLNTVLFYMLSDEPEGGSG